MPSQSASSATQLFDCIRSLIPELQEEAKQYDQDASFPFASMAKLSAAGLFMATVPTKFGGFGLFGMTGAETLFRLLHLLGNANLAIGRVFEAHVNAIELIRRYGRPNQLEAAANAIQAGSLFALWVTDPSQNGLQLSSAGVLVGEKWFCSAAGAANQALVTAQTEAGSQMLVVDAIPSMRAPNQGVKLAGMRAATTGCVNFTGSVIDEDALIGKPGDYLREPVFSTGAWRTFAVALGGLAALIELTRNELLSRGRGDQPYQRMRFGQATIAHETGRLWMLEAASRAESATGPGEDVVAYVNLARTAVEASCLDAIRLIQRSLGLSAFVQGSGAERLARDLGTYLRQPAPDEALAEAAGYFMRCGIVAP